MSLINREMDLLNEIAENKYSESKEKDYLRFNQKSDSYYEEPRTKEYLEPYYFETPVEMKQIIESFFDKTDLPNELLPVVLAATFKLKDRNIKREEIMETIYNF